MDHKTPYMLKKCVKDQVLTNALKELTAFHIRNCAEYKKILDSLGFDPERAENYTDIPPLPAGLFKRLDLSSISSDSHLPEGAREGMEKDKNTAVWQDRSGIKTLTSSGTSGQVASKIYLDAETRTAQQKALAEIGVDFLGNKRLPMLIIDCPSAAGDRKRYTARAAGITGFSLFASKRIFALDDDMKISAEAVRDFLEKYGGEPFLVFGFTYMIWQYFYLPLKDCASRPDLSNAVIIHGGGWKKLEGLNITKDEYKNSLREAFGAARIHDYYGMAEQAGSIFMECEYGRLHCSDYSDVLIRRAGDLSLCGVGESGIIQVVSTLPKSYPGHSILTEDEGVLLGIDDCPCGRMGACFEVKGRLKKAQIRGCSDAY